MTRTLVALAMLAVLSPLSATAEETRMTDGRFLAASRCLAYADVQQLEADVTDFAALRTAVTVGNRHQVIRQRAENEAGAIHRNARRAAETDLGLAQLRARRASACEPFVQSGHVRLDSGVSAS